MKVMLLQLNIFKSLGKLAYLGLISFSLFISSSSQSSTPQFNQEPKNARFIVSDIENFWRAYDLAQKEQSKEKKVEIYQREYFDKASDGLKSFIGLRIGKAVNLVEKIELMPKYYASIRENTLRTSEMRPQMLKSFKRLKEIYPNAVFPDVYFVIGKLSSGGTAWNTGLLIGTEMCSLSKNADQSEFTDWHKMVLKPIDELPGIVAHELIHFQQKMSAKANLLTQSLREGGADFLGEMISKLNINSKAYKYGNANEKALWLEFKAEMDTAKFDKWFYNSNIKDRPADLGYFIGYKICEAYYKKAKDKKQAIADIINFKDAKEFLKLSGYEDKFKSNNDFMKNTNASDSEKVFNKLKTLVGDWEGKTALDKTVKVSYELIANNTVLTENWDMGNSRTSMTVYHLDNKNLIATHYCPWGNQPRLELVSVNDEQNFSFVFVSATNLPDKNLTHQHQFAIRIESSDRFWRSETYLTEGKLESEAITYLRLRV